MSIDTNRNRVLAREAERELARCEQRYTRARARYVNAERCVEQTRDGLRVQRAGLYPQDLQWAERELIRAEAHREFTESMYDIAMRRFAALTRVATCS